MALSIAITAVAAVPSALECKTVIRMLGELRGVCSDERVFVWSLSRCDVIAVRNGLGVTVQMK